MLPPWPQCSAVSITCPHALEEEPTIDTSDGPFEVWFGLQFVPTHFLHPPGCPVCPGLCTKLPAACVGACEGNHCFLQVGPNTELLHEYIEALLLKADHKDPPPHRFRPRRPMFTHPCCESADHPLCCPSAALLTSRHGTVLRINYSEYSLAMFRPDNPIRRAAQRLIHMEALPNA